MDQYLENMQLSQTLSIEELIIYAAFNGYEKLIQKMSFSNLNLYWLSDALTKAAEKGYLEIVKFLIDKGADIHDFDEGSLRRAACNGHPNVVKYLIIFRL